MRLAVFVIISLAAVAAVGTIIEAKYNDADMAQQLVYKSPYMYAVLGLLCVNLIGVMIDRWPWKVRHIPFILAHVGIIMTLIGALMTQKLGVDGSLVLNPAKVNVMSPSKTGISLCMRVSMEATCDRCFIKK